ncbi:MAG TPA: mercuric reductase [Myxococcales bacterium]|nr:mercuric reductase [Myxococcales bacterium]
MAETSVDVIVIGSGQAGVPFATRMAGAGKQVVLIERADLGGTCVNVGCTPTKTMVASARAAHVARTGGRLGVRGAGEVTVDLAAVVARKERIVAEWRGGVESGLRAAGDKLRLVRGHGRFVAAGVVEAGGERFRAKTTVVNVGCRPVHPKLPGLEGVPFLTNRTVMQLQALPKHLVVLGGGYIGCEFAQMFRRFGAEVTIVDRGEHLLSREDPEVSVELEKVFAAEGLRLEQRSKVASVAKDGDGVVVRLEGGKEIRGSHLLVAVGRQPNTGDLGCDAAGIALDDKGFIQTDDHYKTTADGVYAVGDCIGGPQFTHNSWDDHRLLARYLETGQGHGRSGRFVPSSVFTDPQVAGVGLTEREAKKQGIAYELATLPFSSISRALEVDEPAGVLRVLVDPKTERVLGAHIVGADAGELIHIFVALMQAGASARTILDMQAIHPTFAEGVQQVVMSLARFGS